MTDVSLEWHDDFQPDSTGDLQTVDGDDETRQRLERRLFTAEKGYVWHPDYGAGLPQKIGSVLSVEQVQSVVVSQVALEASVAPSPPVQISVGNPGTRADIVAIGIAYTSAVTGKSVSFTITS